MANILVTGAAGSLGQTVVAYLTSLGHRVAAVDLAPLPETGAAAVRLGGIDLTDVDAVTHAYARAATELGSIEAVVNIAGGFTWETLADGAIDSFDAMYRINLRTAAISSRAALAHLTAGGAIVNVGAAAAQRAATGMAAYAASKAGVQALTQALADELVGRGIRVNAVLPTIIDTPANRNDMPDADTAEWVRPQSVAKVIAFLISPESGSITGEGIRLSLAG